MTNNALLEVKNLTIEYTSGGDIIHAVNNVSFVLEKGKSIGLVGETGAGKTTIAKAIMNVLRTPPARIIDGEVLFEGRNMLDMSEEELLAVRRDKISMIFQDPMTALNPTITIGNQVAEVIAAQKGISQRKAREKAIEVLKLVNIMEERFDNFPFQFSGGMKQRVVIAMALACEPELLLADEPTTALDVTIQAQILDVIRTLKDTLGTSMVLITHDLGVVAENCDDVAVVYAGEIVERGTVLDVFDHPSHPYTLGLFHSLPDWSDEGGYLQAIEGLTPDPAHLPEGCKFHPRCPYATEECKSGSIANHEVTPGHFCKCIYPREESAV